MDLSKFDLAMSNPSFQSGVPVFKDDPRLPVQTVLDNLDNGMTAAQIAEAWRIDLHLIVRLQQFVESQKIADLVR